MACVAKSSNLLKLLTIIWASKRYQVSVMKAPSCTRHKQDEMHVKSGIDLAPRQSNLIYGVFTSITLNGIDQIEFGAICALSGRNQTFVYECACEVFANIFSKNKMFANCLLQWNLLTFMELLIFLRYGGSIIY